MTNSDLFALGEVDWTRLPAKDTIFVAGPDGFSGLSRISSSSTVNEQPAPVPKHDTYESRGSPFSTSEDASDESQTNEESTRSIPLVSSGVVPISVSRIAQETLEERRVQLDQDRVRLEEERQELQRRSQRLKVLSDLLISREQQSERGDNARGQQNVRKRSNLVCLCGTGLCLVIVLAISAGFTVVCWAGKSMCPLRKRSASSSAVSSSNTPTIAAKSQSLRPVVPDPTAGSGPLVPIAFPPHSLAIATPTTPPHVRQAPTPAVKSTFDFHQAYRVDVDSRLVKLSGDGNVMAIVGSANKVCVYERVAQQANPWSLRSITTFGENSDILVALNRDGSVMAIASPTASSSRSYNNNSVGSVRVFVYQSGEYWPKGNDLYGANVGANFGYDIALDAAGDMIVIGAPLGPSAGEVVVFHYQEHSSAWTILGIPITGKSVRGWFGSKVAILGITPSDGASHITIAASAPRDTLTGSTCVFRYIRGTWIQLGQDLGGSPLPSGALPEDNGRWYFGRLMDLVATEGGGYRLASGFPALNTRSGINKKGAIAIYEYSISTSSWTLLNQVELQQFQGRFGDSGRLLDQGDLLVACAPGANFGHGLVQVHDLSAAASKAVEGFTPHGVVMDASRTSDDLRMVVATVSADSKSTVVWEEW